MNVVRPGMPNVLEADLARLSMVDSLLLEVALVLLFLSALEMENILRILSMSTLSIGQVMILSARSVTERERASSFTLLTSISRATAMASKRVCLLLRRANH